MAVRLARRGEFTERAFLNGKIGYDEAEGVIDLIDAKTDRAAEAATEGPWAGGLYDAALDLSSTVEHSLDVSEDDIPPGFFASLAESIKSLSSRVRAAMRRLRERKILREGALVVLAGAPNSGKSSLMNALLGESRAIVSDRPGTTRDSIEEWLDVGGWPVRLVDTAGLRETADEIEAEGVRRSESLMAKADVVLMLSPEGGGFAGESPGALRVSSKCDLKRGPGLNVSSVTGEGLKELREEIAARLEALADSSGGVAEESAASRQMAVLTEVDAILSRRQSAAPDLVLVANDLREASEKLGSLVGAVYSADLLDRLFSRFCVGK